VANGVRLEVIGRRDRLPPTLRAAIAAAERCDVVRPHAPPASGHRLLGAGCHRRGEAPLPDVDLLVRTGGEQRLSDFLLRECAYAELYFTPCPWPDFDGAALAAAVAEFGRRQRRFGGLTAVAS
jgi:undecaprenyl diphosphate synthase